MIGFLSEKEERNESWRSLSPKMTGGKLSGKGGGHSQVQQLETKNLHCGHRWRRTWIKQTRRGHALEGLADGAGTSTAIQACPVPSPASDLKHRRITIFFFLVLNIFPRTPKAFHRHFSSTAHSGVKMVVNTTIGMEWWSPGFLSPLGNGVHSWPWESCSTLGTCSHEWMS